MSSSLKKFTDRAIISNTRLTYEKAFDRIRVWLWARNLEMGDSSLAEYLASIHESGSSHSTCSLFVAVVRWMGQERCPAEKVVGNTTTLVLKGIARSKKHGPDQLEGLDWKDVDKVVSFQQSKELSAAFATPQ